MSKLNSNFRITKKGGRWKVIKKSVVFFDFSLLARNARLKKEGMNEPNYFI